MPAIATDSLSRTLAALADPTRRAILEQLALGDSTVTELAAPFAISQPAISKHLRVLRQAGLISQNRLAQRRPCRLEAQPLRDVAEWAERFRQRWDTSFRRLDAFLTQVHNSQASPPPGEPDEHL
jgi:DNA-binding transcriptional ArsR family regulator